jgi:alkylhydroperoxidase family enzyme
MLAGPMPLTTARMLELDALHRTGDRLDARLRAVARWAAADANKCDYGKAMAVADLARAGGQEDLAALTKAPERLPQVDRLAVAFARRMMLEAHAVTDAEVKQLLDLIGEERVVALVALLAHASFQDRILLALNAQETGRGVPPPVTVRFGRPQPKNAAPQPDTSKPASGPTDAGGGLGAGNRWLELEDRREKQKLRAARIRVPSRDEVLRRLGKSHPAAWQAGIVWSRVCYGYQPELTDAWFDCAGAFRQEADFDRVFSDEIFWVVTESLQCFY